MNKHVALAFAVAALALGTSACSMRYVEFKVWEGPDQASEARKPIPIKGMIASGSGYSQSYKALEDGGTEGVDAAIKALDGVTNKDYVYHAYLAVLYEVKHDWAKAETEMQTAIAESGGKNSQELADELAYIQEHKKKYVGQ